MVYRDPPRFNLSRITPPTEEPVTLEEAMEHLNIALDDRHMDGWLNRNIPAAREWCEGWLGRTLAPQTLELSFGGHAATSTVPTYWQPLALNPWVSGSVIELPMGPVVSVTSITYRDSAGDSQTMDAADYEFDGADSISLASGGTWPIVQARRNAIQIRYVAGYTFPDDSPTPYPLPWALHSAMLLMLGHLFDNRATTESGGGGSTLSHEIPLGSKALMEPYRLRMGMA